MNDILLSSWPSGAVLAGETKTQHSFSAKTDSFSALPSSLQWLFFLILALSSPVLCNTDDFSWRAKLRESGSYTSLGSETKNIPIPRATVSAIELYRTTGIGTNGSSVMENETEQDLLFKDSQIFKNYF